MQKLNLTTALAVAGLLVASQVSYANTLAPNLNAQNATANSLAVPVKESGGHGYSGGHGNFSSGHGNSVSHGNFTAGRTMGRPGVAMGRSTMRRGAMMGQGRTYAHHLNRGGGFVGGSFAGWGYGYNSDTPYSEGDGGSCYWNCRNAGYGTGYCQSYSSNFCE